MPWELRPSNAKYHTVEYRHTRKRLMKQLELDGEGCCAERVCVMTSRLITPDMKLHLCHSADGSLVLGMGHARCNLVAAGKEARRRQDVTSDRVRLSPIW
jgi:hypothetical protein